MRFTTAIALIALALPGASQAQQHQHADAGAEKLGTVVFATSCADAAKPAFARAMALMHSFEFAPAIDGFTAAATTDPGCAIAYWGIGMSRWGNPFAAGIKPAAAMSAGRTAIARAKEIGAKTERERAFIDAAERLFADFEKVDQRTRALAYRDAMAGVASKYPDDTEASAFYALSLASSQDPTDMSYASLVKAGEILERLAPKQPDHPGFVHYIIHSYDAPPLAARALDAARKYAKIAPSAPHALHMPSHTFTRLGYWQDSIDTNIASADAARREKSPYEELHAMDYEMYAYLQMARDASAKQLLDSLSDVRARFSTAAGAAAVPPFGGAFALAAIPARYSLERRDWAGAARLDPVKTPFPHVEAIIWFAKALGAAHTKDVAAARTAIDTLAQLHAKLEEARETYWAEQVKIQHLGASAWLAFAEGRTSDALTLMREAADREDKTEKNAVTPGPIAPAREQLGEMLMALNQPDQALAAFEITLKKEPNRFRALAGGVEAERRAKKGGESRYVKPLLTLTAEADGPPRPEIAALKAGAR